MFEYKEASLHYVYIKQYFFQEPSVLKYPCNSHFVSIFVNKNILFVEFLLISLKTKTKLHLFVLQPINKKLSNT